MKLKQLLTAIFIVCISALLITSCSGTKKPERSIKLQLLNFDQLESGKLKEKGFVSNSLYIGIEFKGYGNCENNAPVYFASVDSIGFPLGVNTMFINKVGDTEYVEFMNAQRASSDETHKCYYETTIPDTFIYLNGKCPEEDFILTIKAKFDSTGEYLQTENFNCEAVLSALNHPDDQSGSISSSNEDSSEKLIYTGRYCLASSSSCLDVSNQQITFPQSSCVGQIEEIRSDNTALVTWSSDCGTCEEERTVTFYPEVGELCISCGGCNEN